ncbi:MAG: CDP-diacylglycerol--serine O-phosphatidyltransferase [Hyphomicrobiaceae bacterium]|nr:CDP-diacylglycerol--serine O-phosphatidyltransferase [Hyphomicrobiaceae bacterium]MCC0011335.1 CDP-diacylglycerol--serine O-phosphatidyltransferase [Hyphomicrobiaceae bacterium]
MDPILPQLEEETRRRRGRLLFRHRRIPVRMLVPNFFTLLGLSAGLTSIRMSIEGRYDLALAAIVFAALLDGLDGRVARLLKASSRFGAELDSLADFVNFGVAPAVMIFTWGLGDLKSIGWIAVMIFALASALRLARFNVMIDEDKPRWQKDFFTGMPTPAAAIVVLLPVYLAAVGLDLRDALWMKVIVIVYTLTIGFLMVSNIPTYSGKLLGERISREWVLPIFVVAVAYVAMLVTYPHETLAGTSVLYLAMIPVGWRRFQRNLDRDAEAMAMVDDGDDGDSSAGIGVSNVQGSGNPDDASQRAKVEPAKDASTTDRSRVVELRTPEPRS